MYRRHHVIVSPCLRDVDDEVVTAADQPLQGLHRATTKHEMPSRGRSQAQT